MLTGTPLDLTPFGALLTGIGWFYWLLTAAGLWWALRGNRPWKAKLLRALPVALVFGLLPGLGAWKAYKARSTLNESMALFQERCKTAGMKVYRTIENVDGVLLVTVPTAPNLHEKYDRNWVGAGRPYERAGDDYLRTFLYWEHHEDKRNVRGYLNNVPSDLPGYRFVDVSEASGSFVRHELLKGSGPELTRQVLTTSSARYGVSVVNVDDQAGRAHWIAGIKVLITDMTTNEPIAEHAWFTVEPGQGSKVGFRDPWLFGNTCPTPHMLGGTIRSFVDQVLKPLNRGQT